MNFSTLTLAVPLLKGQLSCREVMNGERLTVPVCKDQPLTIDMIDSQYCNSESLKEIIFKRGI